MLCEGQTSDTDDLNLQGTDKIRDFIRALYRSFNFHVVADDENKGWKMLLRMGWKKGKGLGSYEDGVSSSNLISEDVNGRHGFGLRHASDRSVLQSTPLPPLESWDLGNMFAIRCLSQYTFLNQCNARKPNNCA
jgi:hypothetical protein